MASFLRNLLPGSTKASGPSPIPASNPPEILRVSPPPAEDDDGSDTEKEKDSDDDSPPAFPSLNSAQRAQVSSIPRILSDNELMPPPPAPGLSIRTPGVSSARLSVPAASTSLAPSSSLAVPPTTTKPPTKPSKKREKVALAPGHSPLDWAALKSSGKDLRGVDSLMRIPPSVLKQHVTRDDAWSAFNGKVYNITSYLAFHPGGEKQLMRVAGRDGTKLFAQTHAWVNVDFMLDTCLVGFLVPEP